MTEKRSFCWETGRTVESAAELNYETTDRCDDCGEAKFGIMLHAEGATGRCCPVMFFCYDCQPHLKED